MKCPLHNACASARINREHRAVAIPNHMRQMFGVHNNASELPSKRQHARHTCEPILDLSSWFSRDSASTSSCASVHDSTAACFPERCNADALMPRPALGAAKRLTTKESHGKKQGMPPGDLAKTYLELVEHARLLLVAFHLFWSNIENGRVSYPVLLDARTQQGSPDRSTKHTSWRVRREWALTSSASVSARRDNSSSRSPGCASREM